MGLLAWNRFTGHQMRADGANVRQAPNALAAELQFFEHVCDLRYLIRLEDARGILQADNEGPTIV